jgi:hypothetical protein
MSPSPESPVNELRVALCSVLFGIFFGTGVIALALWGVRTLQLAQAPDSPARNAPALLLLGGTFGGLLSASIVAWVLMAPVTSAYRRGGLAVVSGFTTLVLALLAIPVDRALGRTGLLVLGALCGAGCVWIGAVRRG